MYKNILIPTDGSELAGKAVEHGIGLAKAVSAKVVFLTVYEPYRIVTLDPLMVEYTPEDYKKLAEKTAAKILSDASQKAQAAGVPCEALVLERDRIHEAIVDTATTRKCDLITMASHGHRGVAALLLGSVTLKVLTHAKIPVLVHRQN
ncbi:MAG TPA: universal stress protein [Candidatus Angelobacter sp.]|jgi:nucleotide-binding universal stress UspA family protein|nr:universal stress protein [Candidatus Angelobacter sp.]